MAVSRFSTVDSTKSTDTSGVELRPFPVRVGPGAPEDGPRVHDSAVRRGDPLAGPPYSGELPKRYVMPQVCRSEPLAHTPGICVYVPIQGTWVA